MNVDRVAPVDVGGITDSNVQAALLYAVALGWSANRKLNKPVIIVAPDKTTVSLPSNTSVRFNVFRHWINTIVTHRAKDHEPTTKLIESIAGRVKLTPMSRRVMYDSIAALGSAAPPDAVGEPAEIAVVEPEYVPTLVSRKPWKVMSSSAPDGFYMSDSSYELIYDDGSKKYECKVCGQLFETSRAVGGHKGFHVKKGEAEPSPQTAFSRESKAKRRDQHRDRAKDFTKAAGGPEPKLVDGMTEEEAEEIMQAAEVIVQAITEEIIEPQTSPAGEVWQRQVDEVERLRDVLKRIAELAESEELSDLLHENARLREENERLQGQLDLMAEFFSEVRK